MHNYVIIKLNYTDQKKLLPNFLKFKLNKRGVCGGVYNLYLSSDIAIKVSTLVKTNTGKMKYKKEHRLLNWNIPR